MAGVKGRSGRKAKPAVKVEAEADGKDMLQLLIGVALGRIEANALQVRAAIAAVQYTHTKTHDGGKKDARKGAAKVAAAGKFAPAAPPKLVVNNGR